MSLVEADELGTITGPALAEPALAGVIADDLEVDSRWQVMNGLILEELKAREWSITHGVNGSHSLRRTKE